MKFFKCVLKDDLIFLSFAHFPFALSNVPQQGLVGLLCHDAREGLFVLQSLAEGEDEVP